MIGESCNTCMLREKEISRDLSTGCARGEYPMSHHYGVWRHTPVTDSHISRVSCQKGHTRHAYAWQIGPFWQDTLDMSGCLLFDVLVIGSYLISDLKLMLAKQGIYCIAQCINYSTCLTNNATSAGVEVFTNTCMVWGPTQYIYMHSYHSTLTAV